MDFFNELVEYLQMNELIDFAMSLLIILFFAILGPMIAYIFIKVFKMKDRKIKQNAFYKPLKMLLLVLGIYIALKLLILPEKVYTFLDKIFKICIIIFTAKAFANLFNTSSNSFKKIRKMFNFTGNDGVVNLVSKVIKGLIYIVAGFIIISELGYDLSGLVAGLGIGSVVLALAVQDVAKNILAGFSIIADKPFAIGDSIEVGIYIGTVEDISFKSTRIRNSNNQLIIIPNNQIAASSLINHSKIVQRKYSLRLTLALSTPLDKVARFNDNIKLFLLSNENIIKDSIKAYFDTISANGIDIVVEFATTIVDYMEFIQLKEKVNYKILQIAEKGNIELAYNAQALYMRNDTLKK